MHNAPIDRQSLTTLALAGLVAGMLMTNIACKNLFQKSPPSDPMVVAAWSQISGNDGATNLAGVEARFVVKEAGPDCKDFVLMPNEGASSVPSLRPQVTGMTTTAFPVKLCQLIMPHDWDHATLQYDKKKVTFDGTGDTVEFAGPNRMGRSDKNQLLMAGIGDTGCRGKNSWGGRSSQDCHSAWFFNTIIDKLVTESDSVPFDLVVHVGDYRYRRDKNGTKTPDTWQYWVEDFFSAAQPLLSEVPWVFVRGNHEECSEYGMGWTYLFGAANACPSLVAPWAFDVGIRSGARVSEKQRFVVIDTSPAMQDKQNFKDALELEGHSNSEWWFMHKPYVSFSSYESDKPSDVSTREGLLKAWKEKSLCGNNQPCEPNTILAGHQHFYQRSTLTAGSSSSPLWSIPQQYILGNSGVYIDTVHFDQGICPADSPFKPNMSDFNADIETANADGWVIWTRNSNTASQEPSGWSEDVQFLASTKLTSSNCSKK